MSQGKGKNSAHDRDEDGPATPAPAASPEASDGAAGPPAPDESEQQRTIGEVLSEARLDAGLTVEQVSEATMVRTTMVRAIEQNDFSRCGGDVYARGHIRSLAHVIGVDGEALVAQYDTEHGGPEAAGPAVIFESGEGMRPERRRPNWSAAMVAAIVVVIAFVAVSVARGGGGSSGGRASGDSAAPSASASAPRHHSPSGTPAPSPSPSRSDIAAAPADRVTVKVTAAQDSRSWVQVMDATGTTLYQQVLKSGDSRTFTDKDRIKLILGNAGAVRLAVNGKDLGAAGNDGQIRRLSFTKGDPTLG